MRLTRRKGWIMVGAVAIIGLVVGYAVYELYATEGFETWVFRIKVSYQGSFTVSYQGYEGGPPRTVASHGNYTETGNITLSAPVYGDLAKYGLYICAWATKVDSSNKTLILSIYDTDGAAPIGGYHNTSAPEGSVMSCGGVIP